MSARDESPHTLAESWCEVCRQFCYPPVEGAITNLCGCCDARVRADERERILTEDQALGSLVRKDQDAITRERLRAQVGALPDVGDESDPRWSRVYRSSVLRLLSGESDD